MNLLKKKSINLLFITLRYKNTYEYEWEVYKPFDSFKDFLSKLEYEIKPIIASQIKAYERVMDFFYDAFNDFNVKNSDIFFQGKTNILKQPEYDSPEKIKNMIGKLENMDLIKKIETDDKDVNIFIGEENKFDPSVTVVRTSYNIDGEEGTIAIIGPKRMEYDKVVTLLNYLKNYIER